VARPLDNDDARDDWLDRMMIESEADGALEGAAAGHSDESAEQLRARLHAGIDQVLGAGGLLSEEGGHYEERPQQLQMARAVADAFVANKPAVIEAGTGTGKTLAYLVPALLSGRKVVVSTATKALQEQLVDKDLPRLQHLGLDFSFALMKGRSNYLCLVRRRQFEAAPVFVSRQERDIYPRLRAWADSTATGDRAELDLPDGYVAWRDLSATSETCLGQNCPQYQDCHVTRMRQRAQESDVVVVNHHLFFADQSVRRSTAAGAEVIPRWDAVVFDEAHNIEAVATEFFGMESSSWRFFDLCRDVDRIARARGDWPTERVLRLTSQLGRSVDAFFDSLADLAPAEAAAGAAAVQQPPRSRARATAAGELAAAADPAAAPEPVLKNLSLFEPAPPPVLDIAPVEDALILDRAVVLESPVDDEQSAGEQRRDGRWTLEPGALDTLTVVRDDLLSDTIAVREILSSLTSDKSDPEVEGLVRRCEELRSTLQALAGTQDASLVYWAELRGRGAFLRASPIDISGELRRGLFDEDRPVVLTSATLAAGGDTVFFQRRIGLPGDREEAQARGLVLPSPFDYAQQAALYIPAHISEPSAPEYLDHVTREVAALIALARGRTFVLFTSVRNMREVHRRLAPRIPYQVLLQGERPKAALVRAFCEQPSVLFATASFWEGVDIPGDALSMVVIDKLPFASPAEPLVAARQRAIEERGGSAFGEYLLPDAAITLKQGFGRLIRSRRDTGAVAILDRRLWSKSYGKFFRRSLPECPTFAGFPDLKAWWRQRRGETPESG